MTTQGKRILILLGGLWHNFDDFTNAMQAFLEPIGFQVEVTYDLDSLSHLDENRYDVVLSYTCFSPHREGYNDTSPEGLTNAQIAGLSNWIHNGGALLALHAATVIGESDPALGELIGGVFVSHPPPFIFTIYPLFGKHPITSGIEAFTVHDEFYMETHTPEVDVHMVAIDRGVAYPMVWSKTVEKGRVVHIAPGHSREVWDLAPYQQLLLQAIEWLTERK